MRLCQSFKDQDYGKHVLLGYYHWQRIYKEGLELATELTSVPKYAADAWWKKAEMLQRTRRYDEAIAAYQQCTNAPTNLYRIAECHAALGRLSAAVGQLQEIENFFKNYASDACLKIAWLYRDAGKNKEFIAQLRSVLKKYPGSSHSSTAHQELESRGYKPGGGQDAE